MAEESSPLDSISERQATDPDYDEAKSKVSSSLDDASAKVNSKRLFGRERPVHSVLGGGKPADIILWRNKKTTAMIIGGAAAIWLLFEVFELHLLAFVCNCFIVCLAGLFLWSNASAFIHKSKPNIPEVQIPEETVLNVAALIRQEINQGFAVLRDIASGSDLAKFLTVIACLWVVSFISSRCSFLTLFFIVVVMLHTVPALYEKYDDIVDAYFEKGMVHARKQYAVINEKVLSKVPKSPLKSKKKD